MRVAILTARLPQGYQLELQTSPNATGAPLAAFPHGTDIIRFTKGSKLAAEAVRMTTGLMGTHPNRGLPLLSVLQQGAELAM